MPLTFFYQRQNLQLQSRVPCGKTWVVARDVTKTFNPTMKQCVLNQTRKFWLLSNFSQATLIINVKLQTNVDCRVTVEPLLQCGNCRSKLKILYTRMATEAVKVLATFIFFAQICQCDKTHNMMTFMFDPMFKSLTCVCEFVGREKAMEIIHKYDQQCLLPMFVKMNN